MSKSLTEKINEVRAEERKKAAQENEEATKKLIIEHQAAMKAKDSAL